MVWFRSGEGSHKQDGAPSVLLFIGSSLLMQLCQHEVGRGGGSKSINYITELFD